MNTPTYLIGKTIAALILIHVVYEIVMTARNDKKNLFSEILHMIRNIVLYGLAFELIISGVAGIFWAMINF